MAKKIKFPLDMGNGIMVRSLEELKDNFSLEKILSYYTNGKLLTWLNDRYYESEVNQIAELESGTDDFEQKLCGIFDVEYSEQFKIDLESINQENIKINKLKQFTKDESIIENVDSVAFNQEDLDNLLNEAVTPIYLLGEKFTIPIDQEGITFIGVNNPTVVKKQNYQLICVNNQTIVEKTKVPVDLNLKNIVLGNVSSDEDNKIRNMKNNYPVKGFFCMLSEAFKDM